MDKLREVISCYLQLFGFSSLNIFGFLWRIASNEYVFVLLLVLTPPSLSLGVGYVSLESKSEVR